MARRHRRHRALAEINVVPYIDVMLVLLVIFMVSVPLVHQALELELPPVEADPLEDLVDRALVFVQVDRQGRYFVHLAEEAPALARADQLAPRVTALLAAYPDALVLLRGDRGASYGQVIEVLGTLRRAGVDPVLATALDEVDDGA
ncbi:MAG: ExbD/TolR family protein [Candidatus Competibacterales bacterium]